MDIFSMRKLKMQLEHSKAEANEYKRLHSEMVKTCKALTEERDRLKEQLESATAAKETGCVRGIYCHYCKHHVMGYTQSDSNKCYCTYGMCPHFVKEDVR